MKTVVGLLALTTSMSAFAVDGYKDIYLDKKQDIVVHGLMCGNNLDNFNHLKPAAMMTNTPQIEKGTYYFKTAYGEYSLTFDTTEKDTVMHRGLLQGGKTSINDMDKKLCIVKDVEGLPKAMRRYLTKTTLKADDKNWTQTMKNYEMVVGKPAFGKGIY